MANMCMASLALSYKRRIFAKTLKTVHWKIKEYRDANDDIKTDQVIGI